MTNKNKVLALIFSVVPGVGHLYLGYTRLGLSMMAVFFGIITFADFTGIGFLNIVLPFMWLYGFVDVLKMTGVTQAPEDTMLFEKLSPDKRVGFWLGGGLIALGLYILAQRLILPELSRLLSLNLAAAQRMISTAFISVVFVLAGIALIMGKKVGQ